ncbi:MAG: cation diffusion facilitator family transporter, partial [Deltaproteobacteria bacterium]|nr:cation diffusion facilitator family transporter [Deltaproteobacteria bacterium]
MNTSNDQIRAISRVTGVGMATNLILITAKFLGGWWSGSRTLIADAVHSLSDLATDLVILAGVRFWTAPADADHPYGHGKIEAMIIVAIGLALAGVGLGLAYGAVKALAKPPSAPLASLPAIWTGLAVAAVSIITKEWLYRWTAAKGTALKSSVLVANAWHHRSDALSSIPTTIALGGWAIGARQGWNLWYLDPVCAVVVAVMILAAAWG